VRDGVGGHQQVHSDVNLRGVPALSILDGLAEPVAILLVTTALTFTTLVFGELAPKRLAMQHPEQWALAAAVS